MSEAPVTVSVKWGKELFSGIAITPSKGADALKKELQSLTGVPVERQKVMCKGGWKGMLKDTTALNELSSGLTISLIGTAEKIEQKEPVDFAKLEAEALKEAKEAEAKAYLSAEGLIVALQKPPIERGEDEAKKQMYAYSRLAQGQPQGAIEELLRNRRAKTEEQKGQDRDDVHPLLGVTAMTLGLEMDRS